MIPELATLYKCVVPQALESFEEKAGTMSPEVSRYGRTPGQAEEFYQSVKATLRTKLAIMDNFDPKYSPMLLCEGCKKITPHTFKEIRDIVDPANNKTTEKRIFGCSKCDATRQYGIFVQKFHGKRKAS